MERCFVVLIWNNYRSQWITNLERQRSSNLELDEKIFIEEADHLWLVIESFETNNFKINFFLLRGSLVFE